MDGCCCYHLQSHHTRVLPCSQGSEVNAPHTHTHTHTHTHVYINILSFPHFDSRKNLLATDAVAQIFQTQPIPFPYFFIIPKPPWGIYFSLPLANHPPGKKIKNKKALKFFIIVKTAEPYMYIYPFFCL